MKEGLTGENNKYIGKIVLTLSILVSVFWYLVNLIDVYQIAVVGAIFELLWLPMIAMLFILPIFSIVYLVKEKFSVKSFYLYSIIIIGVTFLGMTLLK